jgi:hypothetical protein
VTSCGNGGAGIVSSITGSPVQYAGGGGGGGYNSNPGGLGTAGGGNGGYFVGNKLDVPFDRNGTSGLNNTGGGGGACTATGDGWLFGAAGGSGIVVIRYPSYQAAARVTTGNPRTYVNGPWRVYIFNASGTITF